MDIILSGAQSITRLVQDILDLEAIVRSGARRSRRVRRSPSPRAFC